MPTTAKGYPYPTGTDPNDVPSNLQALAVLLDARPGVSALTSSERDGLSGAELWNGRVIYNLTASRLERYRTSSNSWIPGSITDHGELTGLLDDDHPQYALDNEVVRVSGDQTISGLKDFTGEVRGTFIPIPFYVSGPIASTGARKPRFVAPRAMRVVNALHMIDAGSGLTYRLLVNDVPPAGMGSSPVVGTSPGFFEIADVEVPGGSTLRLEILFPGSGASDLSVTVHAIAR